MARGEERLRYLLGVDNRATLPIVRRTSTSRLRSRTLRTASRGLTESIDQGFEGKGKELEEGEEEKQDLRARQILGRILAQVPELGV
jgi:hypothetical protein